MPSQYDNRRKLLHAVPPECRSPHQRLGRVRERVARLASSLVDGM
jgi:hypothetical protein